MRMMPTLDEADVERIVKACKAAAKEKGRRATIALVDNAGHLLYLERPEVNGVNTSDMAFMKARTAALRGRPSSNFAQRVKDSPGSLTAPNYLGVDGGVPVFHEQECIGGVGVSGIDHDDEPIAAVGAALFPKKK
jgi:glc operon protein GlcG